VIIVIFENLYFTR